MHQQVRESDEVQARKQVEQAFVVTGEAAEARREGERPLDDPALRQEHEAVSRCGKLDDLQVDAMGAAPVSGCTPVARCTAAASVAT